GGAWRVGDGVRRKNLPGLTTLRTFRSSVCPRMAMDADSYVVPDLLFAQPSLRIDLEATDTALVFAFAGSTSGGLFSEALARSRLPRTSWEKDGFAADLFVERFVRDCMRGNRPGERPLAATEHLVRLLCAPPIR